MRLTGRFAVLEATDALRYGFGSATDTFLNEVCREVCLVFQIAVEGFLGFVLARNAVVVMSPRPIACLIRAVEELFFCLMEIFSRITRYIEFDDDCAMRRVLHRYFTLYSLVL